MTLWIRSVTLRLCTSAALAACALLLSSCRPAGAEIVAQAGGRALTVTAAAQLLARNPKVTTDSLVVQAFSDLWVEYALLADALSHDSTLKALDIEALVAPAREQAIITRLRDRLVHVDTTFTDEEVHARQIAAGIQVGAFVPEREPGANERRREQQRERDRQSGKVAAGALSPAAVANEQREEYRKFMVETARLDAEGRYLDSMVKAVQIDISPASHAAIRRIAARPGVGVGGKAGSTTAVARYRGGMLSEADVDAFVRSQPPHVRAAVVIAPDGQLQAIVLQLVQKKLLLAQAVRAGVVLSPADEQALRSSILDGVRREWQQSGVTSSVSIDSLLLDAMSHRGSIVPLNLLGVALRSRAASEIHENTFPAVVQAVAAQRKQLPP